MDTGKKGKTDLIGKRFGKLTVEERTDQRRRGAVLWKCQCDCGNICLKPTSELNAGLAVSCGCAWRQPAVRTGDRFGRLTALEPTGKRRGKSVVWKCQCECGKILEVRATLLQSGHTKSCGCMKAELDQGKILRNLTYQDDTCIEFLKKIAIPTKSNSTDVRGVVLLKDGRYQAGLTFRKKRYYLGRFDTLEEAAGARKKAEVMVEEYLEQYAKKGKNISF